MQLKCSCVINSLASCDKIILQNCVLLQIIVLDLCFAVNNCVRFVFFLLKF